MELTAQLRKETDFIIVDNGTVRISSIVESINIYEQCKEIICLDKNEGLAKALNVGINWSLRQSYEFVFLFDQDSSLCDLFVERMIRAYTDAREKVKANIAAVGPRIINPQTMRQTSFKLFNSSFDSLKTTKIRTDTHECTNKQTDRQAHYYIHWYCLC